MTITTTVSEENIMNRIIKILLVLGLIVVLGSLLFTVLGLSYLLPVRSSTQTTTQSEINSNLPSDFGLANPASTYCLEQGYSLEILEDEDGNQYGMCAFSDGSQCEEWAYFRGECVPAAED
jgi:putative hemolysin